jgi:hypothetical protein
MVASVDSVQLDSANDNVSGEHGRRHEELSISFCRRKQVER